MSTGKDWKLRGLFTGLFTLGFLLIFFVKTRNVSGFTRLIAGRKNSAKTALRFGQAIKRYQLIAVLFLIFWQEF